MKINKCKEFQSSHFERHLFVNASDEELTLETSALKLFTLVSLDYQLS